MSTENLHTNCTDTSYVPQAFRRGRGAVSNRSSRFERKQFVRNYNEENSNRVRASQTEIVEESARSILNRNKSPDVPFEQSLNVFRGCAHGCIYCYARPAHTYMGLSAGLDFERIIYTKKNAAELLEAEITKPTYVQKPIAIGTNTDPYQPLEKEVKLTRSVLKVLNKYNHPVSILTKSKLIVRDIDILEELAFKKLVKVSLSVTSLDPKLSRVMEPRASSPQRRLDAIRLLSGKGISTGAMIAPVIPAINDHEIENILKAVSHAGAARVGYIPVRLPAEVQELFEEWLAENFPNRKDRVLNRIRGTRGGRLNDPRFGHRMKGSGIEAKLLSMRFHHMAKRLGLNCNSSDLI